MHLRGNGGQGAHALLRRFYMDNKKLIIRNGEEFSLGDWIRAVHQGKTAPKAAEAPHMLKDINEKCTQDQLAVIEAALDWTPMILGDGHVVGSLVQKYYCEV
eukprot:5513364-Karenia_brevis.AAC.2